MNLTQLWAARITSAYHTACLMEEKPVTVDHPADIAAPVEKDLKFHLDTNSVLQHFWLERERRRRQILDNEKWIKEFDAKLAKAMGDKEELYLDGARVAVYSNNGTFKKNMFLSEQPEVAEACMQWKQVLDLDVLKSKYPDVYKLYRARAMNVKDEPVTPS